MRIEFGLRCVLLLAATIAESSLKPNAYADVMLKAREAGAAVPTAAAAPTSTKDSEVYVVLNMPLSKLEMLANQYQVVIRPKGTVAVLVSYAGILTVGSVKIAASNQSQFPLQITAPFDFTGTIAGNKIEQSGEATVDVGVQNRNGCVILNFGNPSVSLNAKPVPAAVTRSIPSLSDFIATKILQYELNNWTTCAKLRDAMKNYWHPLSSMINSSPKQLFLNVEPHSLAISDLAVTGSDAKLTVAIGGVASIASKADSNKPPLPTVQKIRSRQTPTAIWGRTFHYIWDCNCTNRT